MPDTMIPGLYSCAMVPEAVYHADPFPTPSASASILSTLYLESPLHAWAAHPKLNPAWQPRKSTPEQAFGTAAHAMVLGNKPVTFIDAPTWQTKDAKARRDALEAAGHIVLLEKNRLKLLAMAAALKDGLSRHQIGNPFETGEPEVTVAWQEDGSPIRGRMDWWNEDRRLIVDYKTTSGSASPDLWSRQLFSLGSDFQAALYPRGVAIARGFDKMPDFVFIVQEMDAPFAFSVLRLSPSARDLAENKAAKAFHAWRHCLKANDWPGYPNVVCDVDVPAWEARAEAEREAVSLIGQEGALLQ